MSHIALSMRLAGRDTREVQGTRMGTGLLVSAIAVVIASLATRKLAALWTVAAYDPLLVATYGWFVARRPRGWNRLWYPSAVPRSNPERQALSLALKTTGPMALMYGTE
jgi:hypothetical protein